MSIVLMIADWTGNLKFSMVEVYDGMCTHCLPMHLISFPLRLIYKHFGTVYGMSPAIVSYLPAIEAYSRTLLGPCIAC